MTVAAALTTDILIEKRRRLNHLERQAARFGAETPPHIATEIADLRDELGAAAAPASEAERYETLFDLIREVRRDVRQLYWLIPVLMVTLCAFLVLLVKL